LRGTTPRRRSGGLSGGGVHAGEDAWGRPDARHAHEGTIGDKRSEAGAFTPAQAHSGRPWRGAAGVHGGGKERSSHSRWRSKAHTWTVAGTREEA
jgi:hypothetical protein